MKCCQVHTILVPTGLNRIQVQLLSMFIRRRSIFNDEAILVCQIGNRKSLHEETFFNIISRIESRISETKMLLCIDSFGRDM